MLRSEPHEPGEGHAQPDGRHPSERAIGEGGWGGRHWSRSRDRRARGCCCRDRTRLWCAPRGNPVFRVIASSDCWVEGQPRRAETDHGRNPNPGNSVRTGRYRSMGSGFSLTSTDPCCVAGVCAAIGAAHSGLPVVAGAAGNRPGCTDNRQARRQSLCMDRRHRVDSGRLPHTVNPCHAIVAERTTGNTNGRAGDRPAGTRADRIMHGLLGRR